MEVITFFPMQVITDYGVKGCCIAIYGNGEADGTGETDVILPRDQSNKLSSFLASLPVSGFSPPLSSPDEARTFKLTSSTDVWLDSIIKYSGRACAGRAASHR